MDLCQETDDIKLSVKACRWLTYLTHDSSVTFDTGTETSTIDEPACTSPIKIAFIFTIIYQKYKFSIIFVHFAFIICPRTLINEAIICILIATSFLHQGCQLNRSNCDYYIIMNVLL